MKNTILFFAIIFSVCQAGCKKSSSGSGTTNPPVTPVTPAPPTTPKTYQLVWSDEFNTDGAPDPTHWGYDVGGNGWGNNELEYYTNARPENARVLGGSLIIEARKESFSGRNYTSARLLTKDKAQWAYGKFEIKAKIPKGRGTWPAIWLLAANTPLTWPDDGELDIMEEVGYDPNKIYGTAHNKLYNGANGLQKGGNMFVPDAQDSFHVYSIEWTTNKVTWSIDNVEYFTYGDPGLGFNGWPYSRDFFLILNVAVGGNWGGIQGVDDTVFPQKMMIDYVRVYQLK
ncbi:MAG: glycoside hydrolase family 16 [Chitinophagaceae bacterium]|nr:glycoside hydrolase family 16 [Chitinophagaceae bacterium]